MSKKIIAFVNTNNRYDSAVMTEWAHMIRTNLDGVEYISFPTIQSLFPVLSDPKSRIDMINIDVEVLLNFNVENPYTLITTLKTLAQSTCYRDEDIKRTIPRNIQINGVVQYDTPVSVIKEMIPLVDSMCLSVSGQWTMNMVFEDQRRLVSGDLTIPRAIQAKLKSHKSKEPTSVVALTPRQKQVMRMVVNRGASNKIIARTLNISESTVKLHVGTILKKYGLKNRTQLAVFGKDIID